jgi:hypothetical protein
MPSIPVEILLLKWYTLQWPKFRALWKVPKTMGTRLSRYMYIYIEIIWSLRDGQKCETLPEIPKIYIYVYILNLADLGVTTHLQCSKQTCDIDIACGCFYFFCTAFLSFHPASLCWVSGLDRDAEPQTAPIWALDAAHQPLCSALKGTNMIYRFHVMSDTCLNHAHEPYRLARLVFFLLRRVFNGVLRAAPTT